MTPENFAYWLQGFSELAQGQPPSPAQWQSIREHLATVFRKVTPPLSVPSVNPMPTISPALPVTYPPFPPQPNPFDWLNPDGSLKITC